MVTQEAILESVANMTVYELCALTKALEEKFDVKASDVSAPVPIGVPVQETKVEEQTSFTVILTRAGENKLGAIKIVRTILNLGLKESKDFVEKAPQVIKEGVEKSEAESIKKQFEDVGVTVEIK